MSIRGINPAFGNNGIVPGLGRSRIGEGPTQEPTRSPEARPATTGQPQQSTRELVPSEAPPGTDPALWKVLSTEERAFFARAREMGPLTYGPGHAKRSDVPTALQGGRIDVKV